MLTRSWPIVDKISKIVGALSTKYQLLLAPYLAIFDKFDNMFDKVVTFDCQMFPKQSGNNLAKILPSPFFLAKVSLPLHLIRSPEEARSPTRCLSQPRREDVKGRCGPPIAALCRGIPGPSFTVTAPWCLHKKTRSALVATLHFCLRRAKLRGFHILRDAPPQAVSREFKAKSRPSSGSGRRIPQIWSVRRIPQKLKQWRSGKLPTIGDALSDWQPQKNRKRSEKQFGSFFQSSKEVDSIRTTLDLLEKYFHFFSRRLC